jgi:hypothetical protein
MDRLEQIATIQDCPEIIEVMLKLLEEHGYKVILKEIEPPKLIKGFSVDDEKEKT